MKRRTPVVAGLMLLALLSGSTSSGNTWPENTGPKSADATSDQPPSETTSAEAQRSPSASPLVIEEVTVEPATPGPDTLCRLRVKLRNRGRQTASRFRFQVEIAGVVLPLYESQLFLQPIAAGEQREIPLFNFWSSETGRPFPTSGPITIEVSLEAATWVRVEPGPGSESRIPVGPVPGLPLTRRAATAKN